MAKAMIYPAGKEVVFHPPVLLYELVRQAGITLSAPCGGNHTCGKCIVRAGGALSPVTEEERVLLRGRNGRLACMAQAVGDVTIRLNDSAQASIVTGEQGRYPTVRTGGYGAAVDIGTTTICMYLLEFSSGRRLDTLTALNRQQAYGADVIARIQHDAKERVLHECIIAQLNDMLSELKANNNIASLDGIAVAANTTMLHFLLGLDASGIAVAPFTPVTLKRVGIPAHQIGILEDCQVDILPGIAAYVGADITAGLLTSGLADRESPALLLDIGTNGEIALGGKDKIYCCGTAAGPAFEGANLSCGTGSVAGAISHVEYDGEELQLQTIFGRPPVGLCGSAVIDLIAILLSNGLIDETGRLEGEGSLSRYLFETETGEPAFSVCDGVYLTQRDIREIQLAKAAIAAGIAVLQKKSGIGTIGKIMIAGGFGYHINYQNAVTVGLLPAIAEEDVLCIGNSSVDGAAFCLLDPVKLRRAEEIAENCQYIELSCDPDFQEAYIEQMYFGEECQ